MAKKNEKIVEQLFSIDLKKKNSNHKLPSRLKFLENVEFHSIAACKTNTSMRREKRILMLPHQIKQLLEINTPALTIPEVNQLAEEIESLKLEIQRHKAEIAVQKEKLLAHEKTIQSLLKKIDESPCPEVDDQTPIIKTNSMLFDNSAHLLRGPQLPGGQHKKRKK